MNNKKYLKKCVVQENLFIFKTECFNYTQGKNDEFAEISKKARHNK